MALVGAILLAGHSGPPALAAELIVEEGVIVRFGADAGLVVRDKLALAPSVTMTSAKDAAAGGPLGAAEDIPAAGDWIGLRIEKSTASFGTSTLSGLTLRYGGAAPSGANGAALTLRGVQWPLPYLQLIDNSIGLRLVEGASPEVSGASFLRNTVGVQAENGSIPIVGGSQFVQNSAAGVMNLTPASIIQATGNWWGHGTGPKDAAGNPQGQGDNVSLGVNYRGYLAQAPLLNPTIRLASPAPFYEQNTIALLFSCLNATEYRIAENGGFSAAVFQPLTGGQAAMNFNTSAGEGRKAVGVQYRNASGNLVVANLANPAAVNPSGVLIDSQAPAVAISTPAPGSVVSQPILVEANVTDAGGLSRVEFYLDGALVATQTTLTASGIYTYAWNTDASSNGDHTLRVVGTDEAGRTGEQSRLVTVSREVPAPDTAGPVITNVRMSGTALSDGRVVDRDAPIAADVADRSGVARVELLLDAQVVANFQNLGSGQYGATFSIVSVPNGSHTLSLRAVDSLSNLSSVAFQVSVAHAPPNAPLLTSPTSGLTTRHTSVTVAGTAPAGTTVNFIVNAQAVGAPVLANTGSFSASVPLVDGINQIQARASDAYGPSALSNTLSVTVDISAPSAPSNLSAVALMDGKVRLAWTRSTDANAVRHDLYRSRNSIVDIAAATRVNSSSLSGTTYDDLPAQDGVWYYVMVAVNALGTPSAPTNQVQAKADATAPKAVSIAYAPQGKVDAATGRIGQGRVDLVLTTSEELQATPYLAIVPAGGVPVVIELAKTTATTYGGFFFVDASTPSGTANAIFSARDLVGNRGTEIQTGATLRIDTDGPALTSIALNPPAPIKVDSTPSITATFVYSKQLKAGTVPILKFLLSGAVRQPIAVAALAQVDTVTWRGAVVLPTDAGLGAPETFSFSTQAVDDLDNTSAIVSAANRFQVYQGNLPPTAIPLGLTGKAQPAGRVQLNWSPVEEAFAYEIYRQGPGGTALAPLARSGGAEYIDIAPADGKYVYAVATIRQSNGQEAISAPSATVEVQALVNAPGAPQNLALALTSQGIKATWQPPAASTVDYYNLYRASGSSINSIADLTPIKTRVKSLITYDPAPSPTQSAYVVTAVDAAGNESAISNSAYLNASLLPVINPRVLQIGASLPTLTWTAPNGGVAGYHIYVGPDASRTRLTSAPITGTTFIDTGYSAGERRYTIATVDATGQEIGRSLMLPAITTQIVSGLPLKRGVMNRLQVQVANISAGSVDNTRVVVRLPTNKESTLFKEHKSDPFTLGANQTLLINVVVGGYAELPASPQAQVGIESVPIEGELVKIARNQVVDTADSALVVGISTGDFVRGATGKVRLTVENTSEVEAELLTALSSGTAVSSELRLKILDVDGNVLASQPYKQAIGASVITLPTGQTVARIAPGTSYTSDVFDLTVPAGSPNSIRVKLEVDKLRYHTGREDEITIAGRGTEKTVSLVDTAYYGEVTDVNPISSFGDKDVVITGRAVERSSGQALPITRLKLILNQQGFERVYSVLTDASGSFVYTFKPTVTDGGLYKVSAIHPDLTDRPEQRSFTINRVVFGPTPYKLDLPRNYSYQVPFIARSGAGTSASNMRFALEPSAQPTGQLPVGVQLQLPNPVSIGEQSQMNMPVVFSANNEAQPTGSIILNIYSDERPQGGAQTGGAPLGQVRLDYALSEAKPFIVATPSLIETGLAQGGTQIEAVQVQNKGLQDAVNLQFSLAKPDGSAAPSWVNLAGQVNGTLAVGERRAVDVSFTPPASVAEGVYEFRLRVSGDNVPPQAMNIYASITQSGAGNALFKASDLYTATLDSQGRLIAGLAGATVTLQNEDVTTVTRELKTDSLGEAYFQAVPAGRYTYRARASNHQEVGGRLQIKPGITVIEPIFLDYNLITVEWSVREITITDRYEITIDATFETDVPAAVVVMQPSSVNLPKMKAGDVFYGELTLTNFGLIRADHVTQKLPPSDPYFRYEFLVELPTTLAPKQRVTIPYRVIALQSLDPADAGGSATGGGCYSYSATTIVNCDYICKNGVQAICTTRTSWFSIDSNCATGGGGGLGSIGGGGGSGGGAGGTGGFGGVSGGTSTSIPLPGKKCVGIPGGK
ncbi:MAG: Ig-like domain-containing protein, partial [Ramlibacter sp.]|nr:Ig-like domain-containing protein [Ramlibacter sp.]